ncbi:MAG TPA: mechanosensitive ion channel domain-containing protein [Vicinamibacterales bacterium]|jgi:small-conductance mechanosensitive channel
MAGFLPRGPRSGDAAASRRWLLAIAAIVCAGSVAAAQRPPETSPQRSRELASAMMQVAPSSESATVTFFNRSIVDLHATVLGRSPAERARTAERTLEDLVNEHISSPVDFRLLEGGALITVASRAVLVLTDADVDQLSGDTLEAVTSRSVARVTEALSQAAVARSLPAFLRSSATALAALVIGALVIWGLTRTYGALSGKLMRVAEETARKTGIFDAESLRSSRLLEMQQWVVRGAYVALCLIVGYVMVGIVLRQFPYTYPWGTSMRDFLIGTAEQLGLGIANAVPGLFTAVLIFLIARFAVRVVALWFGAVERGQVKARWVYPDTAQPTRRLLITLVWLFAIVMAYPYLPGSETEAFKGVSVFLGLMVTFGSSSFINHIMSGFMITYSRALRSGDFVRIGEIEGTVQHVGVLSTKVHTLKNEEVTIPNAVVVSQTITDYSRPGDSAGVFTPTSVTIGYDTPWRQVHAMLLLAAERTPGLRRDPKPFVFQESLEDYYVKYTLWVCLERQQTRLITFDTLHANIQDLFNQYGVQIMSPNYLMDPAAPKVVARKDWYAAPAEPEPKPAVTGAQPIR